MMGEETELIKMKEQALQEPAGQCTLADVLSLQKSDPHTLTTDFNKLNLYLGTICALLQTLFGPNCNDFYKYFGLWMVMDKDIVVDRQQHFPPSVLPGHMDHGSS